MKQAMQRVTDPAALRKLKSLAAALKILKPLIDIDTAYIDTSHFNDAERKKFNEALLDLGQAVQEILRLFRENERDERSLIAQIRLACIAYSRAALIHPWATKHRLGREQTVGAQKARSTKSDAGRKLVHERLDQLFSESPDWLNKKPEAIAKHILPDIDKKVREMPEKERPQLKGRSTVSKYVKEYRRRVK
jgi:hypothetical protein